jgi:parvulin-like peptidyl-prolyl isomerase
MTRTDREQPRNQGWRKRAGWLAGGAAVLAVCACLRAAWGPDAANADSPVGNLFGKKAAPAANKTAKPAAAKGAPPAALAAPDKQKIVAAVNGQEISRNELGQQCLAHFGEEVLETLVNKQLIAEHCKLKNVAVTQAEVQAEITRMAERLALPRDQLLKMLREERGISPAQYANEIIWPAVALRKLAADRLTVSEQDLQQAWDTLYGPAVQARLIACKSLADAQEIRNEALRDPDKFGELAKRRSIDANSASANGMIQPIHKHQGDPEIERVAFALQPGEISDILLVGNQYVLLKCDAHLKAQPVPRSKVDKVLAESIRDKKLRQVSDDLFKELQKNARLENVYNDPVKRKQYPGVAALINGRKLTLLELAEACIDRHGEEMLRGMINRILLEQACKKRKVVVSEEEMQAEIARAAVAMGKTKAGEEPDIEAWLADVKKDQGLSPELYRHDVVWPSVALKKLVGEDAEITKDDLQKSFEANYGERVRCRAIVFNSLRQATKAWEEARDCVHPGDPGKYEQSLADFGGLAERYSIEMGSKTMKGEVPPIQRHGGQPLLEKEAFELKKGDISGIINVGPERYVVLFCEGRTTPEVTRFEDVQKLIYDDLREKKMRLAMSQEFTALERKATIDNYLTGELQSPSKSAFDATARTDTARGLLDPRDSTPPAKSVRAAKGRPPATTAVRPASAVR